MCIKNCKRCGKLFHSVDSLLCDQCKVEDENLFKKIKKFTDNNPNCNILEISKNTGVSKKHIFRFIKNGRLEVSSISIEGNDFRECIKCGKKIISGKICNSCLCNMIENNKSDNSFSEKKSVRMHTYKKNK